MCTLSLSKCINLNNGENRFLRGINSMKESYPPEESMPTKRLPITINFLKYTSEHEGERKDAAILMVQ